jgi:glycosyltransferase involved in cell wall biosynthesis
VWSRHEALERPVTLAGPPLSVVIPAYQAEAHIGEAIESVLVQDVAPVEIIVVDDGSTDGTAAVVSGYRDRVTLIRQPNGGEAAARNTGLRSASSDWVAFLDADDTFLPGRLRAVSVAIASDPTLDAVTTDAVLRHGETALRHCYEDDWPFAFDHQREEILRRNFVFGHVVANRRRLLDLGGFDESIHHAADWAMWIALLLDGGRIGLVPSPLSMYRIHSDSMSANHVGIERGCIAVLERALTNPALLPDERPIAAASLVDHRYRLERALLSDSVDSGSGVRRRALAVARHPEHGTKARVRAVAAFVAPSFTSRVVRRRRRGMARVTTGRIVRESPP